ncbi:hypothetical protein FH972_026051 [Carpinus fangiana]|uniref:Eukaryotic translation initiation factor 3 subunit E n=1 Tax=Carpinus fangiana TaxID=176857 RepID=A0A5N6L2T9_9ROSI|nr:hypothetical protein FH972_026051 [Carpinus fangiana]
MATNGAANSGDKPDYDLLPKLIPHLDRHLVFPVLEFLEGKDDENPDEIRKLKFELLKGTNMHDYVAGLEQDIKGLSEVPAEYNKKRDAAIARREDLEQQTQKLTDLLANADVTTNLRSDKVANFNYLKDEHGVTLEDVEKLYDFGQFLYSVGDYESAADLLFQFRLLSTDNDKTGLATWGKLACEILHANWESAMDEIQKVRESIDTRLFNKPLEQLHHRTWLLHWSLFPFFHDDAAREQLIDLFFTPAYINTIQTACPWILRYLAAAVISGRTNRSGGKANMTGGGSQYQKQLKDLIRIVRQEGYEYRDPVTEFIRALYIDFDFEEAQRKLTEADEVLRGDFFLLSSAEPFVEAARHLISESYCKIHQRIDIKDLSTRLGLSQDEGEKWIVNLIRDTRVDAKIDYKEGTVVMNHPPQSVYQQVIERTKGGFFRTQVLSAAVAK